MTDTHTLLHTTPECPCSLYSPPAPSPTPTALFHSTPRRDPPSSSPVTSSPSKSPTNISGPTNDHHMQTRSKSGIVKPKNILSLTTLADDVKPTSFTQAHKVLKWRQAMEDEFNALIKINTWDLVPYNDNMNLVDCKWIYKIKYRSNGTIERPKTLVVAHGFHQVAGVDFHETYSPVVKPTTIRLILSLVVSCNWVLRQLDVKNAFLYGHLKEEVYMKQPHGFVHPQFPNHVCRLRKSIYGLKQAPRDWYHRFSTYLLSIRFQCSSSDTSMFVFRRSSHIFVLLPF